jgi:hypothetical protein
VVVYLCCFGVRVWRFQSHITIKESTVKAHVLVVSVFRSKYKRTELHVKASHLHCCDEAVQRWKIFPLYALQRTCVLAVRT